ncbi:hypothetical protein ACIPWF_06665 [Paenarthrobacter sp. NPDC089989]|uniref:hypothetical protein n=1 Tax=unclassified Paenarthrobacter TaxID=2634190 RepID=UPI003822D9E2
MNITRAPHVRPTHSGRLARTAAATIALCILGGVGSAYAYWATTGAGKGSATNGTLQNVTVVALLGGDTPQNSLIPGGTADVIVRATNSNPYAVTVIGVTPNGAVSADASHPGCTTTGVTLTPTLPQQRTIPANSSVLLTLPNAASMSTASLSACQGSLFSVPVTLEVKK